MANLSSAAQALLDQWAAASTAAGQSDADVANEQSALVAAQHQVIVEQGAVNDKLTAQNAAHQIANAAAVSFIQQVATDFSFTLPPGFAPDAPPATTPPATPPASS